MMEQEELRVMDILYLTQVQVEWEALEFVTHFELQAYPPS